MEFYIGDIKIKNKVVLAPMAGISNPAYMKICEEMGVGLAFTELISAEAIIRNNQKTLDMLKGIENIKIPIGIQLFGSNADTLALAAKVITTLYKNVFIDINMGCPVPKVALKSESGSALLKNPGKVEAIVKKVVNNVKTPVTVKIRSGWDASNINAVEIAQIIERAGASAITIHPRTRTQGYSGHSDWNIIKKVKENVSIPVIGNGDILSCYDAKKMLEETKCDAVMIGRACIGNPWIIKETIQYLQSETIPVIVTTEERIKMIKKHISYLLEIKPEKVVVLEMRMHIGKYLKGVNGANKLKININKINNLNDINELLDKFLKESKNV